jgi:hypothetical protein
MPYIPLSCEIGLRALTGCANLWCVVVWTMMWSQGIEAYKRYRQQLLKKRLLVA